MSLNADIQTLEPGAPVTLFIVDATALGAELYCFHQYGGVLTFQGQDYQPWPMEATGFEVTGNSVPSPRLKMSNVGGFIDALCLAYDDLAGATVTRKRTLAKYLDGAPEADPSEEFPPDIWFIEQKMGSNSEFVDFELSSALSFDGVQIPRRQIIQNYCPWRYRGTECGYTGPPVADEYDVITTDAARDRCGKRLQSCKLRFGEQGELPFGGFPAAGLTR